MDIEKYREAVRQLVLEYTEYKSSDEAIESKAIIDDERGHYEVMEMGWHDKKRIYLWLDYAL